MIIALGIYCYHGETIEASFTSQKFELVVTKVFNCSMFLHIS